MISLLKRTKAVVCLVLLAAVVFATVQLAPADAASGSITVIGVLDNNEVLYTGDDLQAALNAAHRGSIVSINRFITLTSDLTLTTEVKINNIDRISFGDFRILLSADGAMWLDNRLRSKYYAALSPYSTVVMMQEEDLGGYVYYLQPQDPTFGSAQLTVSRSGELLSGSVDETNALLRLDAAPGGLPAGNLPALVSIPAENAECVNVSVQGAAYGLVSTGATLNISATNTDSSSVATRNYTVVVVGDVNGNGRIDAADANLIACHASGVSVLGGAALQAADANCDGNVDGKDAEFICKKYVSVESYTSPLK